MKKRPIPSLKVSMICAFTAVFLVFVPMLSWFSVQNQEIRRQSCFDPHKIDQARSERDRILEEIEVGVMELDDGSTGPVLPEPLKVDDIASDVNVSDISVNPDSSVDQSELTVDMPDVLTLRETESALKLPRAFSARVGGFRAKAMKKYGGSPHYRHLPLYALERYKDYPANAWKDPKDDPLTTVSASVDTASYTNCRRYIVKGLIPPRNAIRAEDFINYFQYNYPEPKGDKAFSISIESARCPWNKDDELLLIGLKGRSHYKKLAERSANFVFLIDVSGSMASEDKLPLLKRAMVSLVKSLKASDRISIVTYASNTQTCLNGMSCKNREKVINCIESLQAGGCTYGESGINLAYRTAEEHLVKDGNNRIILATDGDFNVGATSDDALNKLIEEKRKSGIYLTILGFGQYNLNDSMMMQLAKNGNGNYYYIDSFNEARKVLLTDLAKTLFTIAKDVKIQLEFNPKHVAGYKLIGYESRKLKKEDFSDDTKDAGDIGSGHTVTYLYEFKRRVGDKTDESDNSLRYQKKVLTGQADSDEMMSVKIRYKDPDSSTSTLITRLVKTEELAGDTESDNLKQASAAAGFAMKLEHSPEVEDLTYADILKLVQSCIGKDENGYRMDLVNQILNMQALREPTERVGQYK